ncbi:hypothetical protein GGI21_000378 [Coemansia aciculifera]|nr:hypothetical protein GGI21_000378 [Coemansia aciculifera]
MLGLADSLNPEHIEENSTMIFDDDDDEFKFKEELMATGVLSSPSSGAGFSLSQAPIRPECLLADDDVFVEVTPAEDIYGPDWRDLQFPMYRAPDDDITAAKTEPLPPQSPSHTMEISPQQPQAMEVSPQPSPAQIIGSPQQSPAQIPVQQSPAQTPVQQSPALTPIQQPPIQTQTLTQTPHPPALSIGSPLLPVPDFDGLKELDRSYTGSRLTYVELVMQAWAHGHCQDGSTFASGEITLMSQLARQTHSALGKSLRSTCGLCLQKCTDTPTPRWRIVKENGAEPATTSNYDMISKMVATMAQYAALLPDALSPPTTDVTELTETRPESSDRRRSTTTTRPNRTLRAKAKPLDVAESSTSNRPLAISMLPPTLAEPSTMGVDDAQSQPPPACVAPGKRVKCATATEKLSNKERREAAAATLARYEAAGRNIQDLLAGENTVVRIAPSDSNCPSLAELTAKPFVPIVLRSHDDEPAHFIVDCRVIAGVKPPNQVQGYHEFGVDDYFVPVIPDRWLDLQCTKYRRWCRDDAGCDKVDVTNSDCPCRFRYIRVLTRLDIVKVGSNATISRFIIAPMFVSQIDATSTSLVVRPATLSPAFGDFSESTTPPESWAELYALFMTAPTLLEMLVPILAVTAEPTAVIPATQIEYGTLDNYGCSAAPCVYRDLPPDNRQSCDYCGTSIMSLCYACCMCSAEMCIDCFADWNDAKDEPRVTSQHSSVTVSNSSNNNDPDDEDGSNIISISGSNRRYGYCKGFNGTEKLSLRVQAKHRKKQFFRASQFTAADIRQVLDKARGVVDLGSIYPELNQICSSGTISDTASEAFDAKVDRLERRTRNLYEHEAWEKPVLYVEPDELTTAEFSYLWQQGRVIVVRGLLDDLDSKIWKPEWWIENFGDEEVSILDCAQDAKPVGGGNWPLRNFYRLFDGSDKYAEHFTAPDTGPDQWEEHRACVRDGILKLKDWPPTEDFEKRLPSHFLNFMASLPFKDYTQRKGKFNLVNRLPAKFVPPDLGPKMYCAFGSNDGEGGVGTTNLHCDMADAVNIMAYAPPEFLEEHNIEVPGIWTRGDSNPRSNIAPSPSSQLTAVGAATWDIYPPEAIGHLREYIGILREKPYTAECAGSVAAEFGDAIHSQETYLTRPQRQQFFEAYNHQCYRVYQIPGDAVFVPAGCAHQVCNNTSAVKVAMDFVSPERVKYSRQLTEDFRQLDSKHPRSNDLLQLGCILFWAFAGKQQQPPPPPKQPGSQPQPKQQRRGRPPAPSKSSSSKGKKPAPAPVAAPAPRSRRQSARSGSSAHPSRSASHSDDGNDIILDEDDE